MSSFLSEEEWGVLRDIAGFLRQFVEYDPERPRYGYIDRLATPYNLKIVELTLEEALREARSSGDFWIPSEESVKRFLELCSRDLRYSTIVAALALAKLSRRR
ncbi:MAG: hypothetical protein QW461_08015 [Candidatus Jordarchaeales archaeon]